MIDRYNHPEIAKIWSETNKYLLWMKIELTFLKRLRGIEVEMPREFPWVQEVLDIEAVTRHDLAAFVQWLEKWLEPKIGKESRFVHFGLTSSDIVDTAFSMMIRDTDVIIRQAVKDIFSSLNNLRREKLHMLGRTHGQAAEKILFNDKLNSWGAALNCNKPGEEPYFGRLAGSVGDYKYFSVHLADAAIWELGLRSCHVNDGQIIHRSVYANYMNSWATLASTIAKITTDIRLLSQTEIGELREGFAAGQVGSSSMPQKRNPILSENLCGLARIIRGYQTAANQDIELWNERDISHSSTERIIFPQAATLLGFMLVRLKSILDNLVVDEKRMSENLSKFEDDIMAQERMLELISDGMSRTEAHKKVKEERLGR